MTQPRKHLYLILYSFVTWLVFYIIGLPEYYQHWFFEAKVAAVVAVTLIYFPWGRYCLKTLWDDGQHLKNSITLAFYLTLPLFIYDYLLLGWYKGLGIQFMFPYWYLSLFYFSFWIQIPFVAWLMEKRDNQARLEHSPHNAAELR